MFNPLLSNYSTIYNVPPFNQIKIEHYKPAFEKAIENGKEEIKLIVENKEEPTFINTIEAIEKIGFLLSQVSSVFFNLNHAHTNKEMQELALEISPKLTEFDSDIWLNEVLFKKVKKVYENRAELKIEKESTQLLDKIYKAFVRRGALLDADKKIEYREISKSLSDLSLQFGQNVLAETNDFHLHVINETDLVGLPAVLIEMAYEQAKSMNKEGWVFTLHMPSFLPFMKYSGKRELRKEMFVAYSSRSFKNNDKDNQQIIKRIVSLRRKKAELLGFKKYSDFVLEERMAQKTEKVNEFLNELLGASINIAKEDIKEVANFAKKEGLDGELQKWDFAYYSEKLKKQKYSIDDEELKPFFKLENVEKGVFDLAHRLWGINIKYSDEIPVYHEDVRGFEVLDNDERFLSVLYIDYFPRPSKQGGAWMTSYRDQHRTINEEIRPIVSLVMNFSKPTSTTPSLLTHNEVRTFLHEFGHALHGMLSEVKYQSLSGTSVYRDFVELPSQLMENWSTEKEWLNTVAFHYKTGEIIPDELIDKIIESAYFQSAYSMVRQLSFGIVDMAWHSLENEFTDDVVSFENEAIKETKLLPDIEGTCTSTGFSHVFDGGYAAGYYGYKWAEVLDADAFEMFKENGIFNKEIASKYRENILEKGGIAHPMELYVSFRGKEPSIEPLLKRSGIIRKERE